MPSSPSRTSPRRAARADRVRAAQQFHATGLTASRSIRLPRDPFAQQRVDDEVARAFAHHRSCLTSAAKRRLNARGAAETMAGAGVRGEQLASALQRPRRAARRAAPASAAARSPRTSCPARRAGGRASRADRRGRRGVAPPAAAHRPRFRARVAARRRADCRRDRRWRRRDRPRARMPLFAKRASIQSANSSAGIFSSRMTGPGLVERAARPDHLLHQARFRAGEHVADLALMLRGGAQRVLDAAAVEAVHRLELVERDDDRTLAIGGEPSGQLEHLVGQPADVARASAPQETRRRTGRGRFPSGRSGSPGGWR